MTNRRVYVSVGLDDIRRGVALDNCGCPVALALMRAIPGRRLDLIRGRLRIFVDDFTGESVDVRLPLTANLFIDRFDLGRPVDPFRFEIEIPERAFAAQKSVA